ERALVRARRAHQALPVISAPHLVLMKLETGRTKDYADVVELLKSGVSPAAVARYLGRAWPELLPRFRALVARARAERRDRPRRGPGRFRRPRPRGPAARERASPSTS